MESKYKTHLFFCASSFSFDIFLREIDHHQGQYNYSNDYYSDQYRDVPNDYHDGDQDGDQNASTDSSDEPCSIM